MDQLTIICEPEVLAVTTVTTIMNIIDLFSCVRFTFVKVGFKRMKTCTCMQLYFFFYLRSERDGGILFYPCVSLSVSQSFLSVCLSVTINSVSVAFFSATMLCRFLKLTHCLLRHAVRWGIILY